MIIKRKQEITLMLIYLLIFLLAVGVGFLIAYLCGVFSPSDDKVDSNLVISEDSKKIGKLDIADSVKQLKELGYTYDEGTIKKILISLSSMLSMSEKDCCGISASLSKGKGNSDDSKKEKLKTKKPKDKDPKDKDSDSKDDKDNKDVIYKYNKGLIKQVFGKEDGLKVVLAGSDSRGYRFKSVFENLKAVDANTGKILKDMLPDYSKYVEKADSIVSKYKIGEEKIFNGSTTETNTSSVKLSEHVLYCLLQEYKKVVDKESNGSK